MLDVKCLDMEEVWTLADWLQDRHEQAVEQAINPKPLEIRREGTIESLERMFGPPVINPDLKD